MTEQEQVQLLPCPFCGGEGSFYRVAGSYGYYSSKTGAQCGNGDCPVQPKIAFDDEGYDWNKRKHIALKSKAAAVTAWNTRQTATAEALEAMREAREALEAMVRWANGNGDTGGYPGTEVGQALAAIAKIEGEQP
jgi:hypothetical protein